MTRGQRFTIIGALIFSAFILSTASGNWGFEPARSSQRVFGVAIGSEKVVPVTNMGPAPPNLPANMMTRTVPPKFLGLQIKSVSGGAANQMSATATAIWALIVPLALIVFAVHLHLGGRQRDRIARGLCGHCGYDRSESARDDKCPECGRFQR